MTVTLPVARMSVVVVVRVLLLVTTLTAVSGQQSDDRCLLDSGGSTQRFFVSEDLPVGSVLGKLSVKGEKQFGILEGSGHILWGRGTQG